MSGSTIKIIAIISSYNEEDVIHHVIGDLIANGLEVYLIDNRSTDGTVKAAGAWLGKGLLKIERFPEDGGDEESIPDEYTWRAILARKQELATQLQADWFVHADADEFRESPWPDMSLADAFAKVDILGYSAVNFTLLNFRPIDDDFVSGTDVREKLQYFEGGEWVNALQVKAWKNTGEAVDIVSTGGHDIKFDGRKIFPVPFILRHYPIRGATHGMRKVLKERVARYAKAERDAGWHNHYDAMVQDKHQFLWDPAALELYNADKVRTRILGQSLNDLLINDSAGLASIPSVFDDQWVLQYISTKLGMDSLLTFNQYQAAFQLLKGWLDTFQAEKSASNCAATADYPIVKAIVELECAKSNLSGDYRLWFMWREIDKVVGPKYAEMMPADVLAHTLQSDVVAIAAAYIDAGHLQEGYDLLLEAQKQLPDDPEVLMQFGKIAVLANMPEDADNIFGQLLVQSPEMAARVADFRRANQSRSDNPN